MLWPMLWPVLWPVLWAGLWAGRLDRTPASGDHAGVSRRGSSRRKPKGRRARPGPATGRPADEADPGSGGGAPAATIQPEPASAAETASAPSDGKAAGLIEFKPTAGTEGEAGRASTRPQVPAADAESELVASEREALSAPAPAGSATTMWRRLPPGARLRVLKSVRWLNRYRVRIAWAFTLAACGLMGAGLVLMTLADSEPQWWSNSSVRTIEMADLARRVENGAITHITADHQGASTEAVEWPVKLSDDGANAWLNLRLPVWLPRMTADEFEDIVDARGRVVERQPAGGVSWPESVEEVRVAFVDDRFCIGARVRTGDGTQVFGATLAPEVRDDGSLWMKAASVSVGRLELPAWMVLGGDGGALRNHLPASLMDSAEGEAIFSKLAGDAPMFEDAVIRLGDGRRVRLLSLEVASDSLVAWFRTE